MNRPGNAWLAKAYLATARLGVMNVIACVLAASAVLVWTWAIPALRDGLESQEHAIAGARRALDAMAEVPPEPPKTQAEERLALFYDNLGEKAYAEQQLKTLFAVATKYNLVLSHAEYKPAHDKNGGFHTYQVHLPVKGPYPAIRQFCEQVLLAIPFASLDEMAFKRESVGNPALEAKLRFTLYLSGETSPHRLVAGMKELAHE